ncbi:MAG TPA: MBL fold metallo-hydrolase [Bryobacteraceae bacterium]|nr:MBL fold metallo-hydrolase [Bryobacteraceae bacterium]
MKIFHSAVLLLVGCVLAQAQVDFVGEWAARYHEDQPERIPGPELGDYIGLPINDAARFRAESWDASIQTLPEWQCRPHPSDYGSRGPADLRVWKDVDPVTQRVVAYHTHVQWQAQERTIWMDGRAHPPADAVHTWQGFSTGKWEGPQLTVVTTHLKEGYVRRNGVPRSDRATLVEHWIRHGNFLTLVSIIDDPVYLTDPLIRTTNWEFAPEQSIDPYPCEVAEEVERKAGVVPHHLPGTNAFLAEFRAKYHLPETAARGGRETMYPEFRAVLKQGATPAYPSPAGHFPSPETPLAAGALHVQKVRGSVYMLSGAGGNVTIQTGRDGVLLVDSGLAANSDGVLAELARLSGQPVRYILNTHFHADHTGGNEKISKAGETATGGDVARLATDVKEGAAILAHENVLKRMAQLPYGSFPTDTYLGARKDLFVNDEGIRIVHLPAAHTDGDSLVFFRRSDVISTGDVFITTGYPFLDLAHGGGIQGELDALNRILGLVIAGPKEEGGTYIVPGHGRLCDAADVAYYRDMLTIIRDRVADLKKKGMTAAQVIAARPTRDYDPRWGSSNGPWTTDQFVEAVYQSLER